MATAAAVGIATGHFGYGYLAAGLLVGVLILLVGLVRREISRFSLEIGVFFLASGIGCYIVALYFCRQYGIPLDALYMEMRLPTHIRRLPYYGIAAAAAGLVVIVSTSLGRREGR